MNDKFDQLAKGVAESVTRRQALKRFGLGLVGMALAGFAFDARACRDSGLPCDPHAGSGPGISCNNCCGGAPVCHTDNGGKLKCVCP